MILCIKSYRFLKYLLCPHDQNIEELSPRKHCGKESISISLLWNFVLNWIKFKFNILRITYRNDKKTEQISRFHFVESIYLKWSSSK